MPARSGLPMGRYTNEASARLAAVSGAYGRPATSSVEPMSLLDTIRDVGRRIAKFGSRNVPAGGYASAEQGIPLRPAAASANPYAERMARDQAARGVAVNRFNSSPLSDRPPQTDSAPARGLPLPSASGARPARGGGLAVGPMSGIYGSRPLNPAEKRGLEIYGGGPGLAKAYNEAPPRSAERAATLQSIWQRGGVPVIGGGTQRAPVQDFGGVDTSPRGIDTGIRPGAYTDEDHAAALAAHRSGDVVGGGPLAPFARLAPTRTRGSGGGGLFTGDRVRRQPSKADRALASAVALENAKNGGAVEAARLNAGVELQKAGLEAETARRGQDLTAATEAAKLKPNATALSPRRVKQDGRYYEATQDDRGQIVYKPLSDAEQQRWGKIDAAVASMNDPATRQAALAYARNPEQSVPVYDWKTGRIAFQPTNPKWDVGTPEWQKEEVAKGQPRYATLASVDPELEAELQWWFQSALQGTPA